MYASPQPQWLLAPRASRAAGWRRSDHEQVLLLGVFGRQRAVPHSDPLEHGAAHVETRPQRGLHAHTVDGADEVAVDLALAQARSVAPDVLQRTGAPVSQTVSARGAAATETTCDTDS